MTKYSLVVTLLLLGIVDQVNNGKAVIEYEQLGSLNYTEVDLSLSACVPYEGQFVYFFKDYKIMTCLDNT